MTQWGYIRLDKTNCGPGNCHGEKPGSGDDNDYDDAIRSYTRQLQRYGVDVDNNLKIDVFDPADRHGRPNFDWLVSNLTSNDAIVVVRLSHLSAEFRWICCLIDRIVGNENAGGPINFVALASGIDTTRYQMGGADFAQFRAGFAAMNKLSVMTPIGPPLTGAEIGAGKSIVEDGGDGGGNGGA